MYPIIKDGTSVLENEVTPENVAKKTKEKLRKKLSLSLVNADEKSQ